MLNKEEKQERKAVISQLKEEIKILQNEKVKINQLIIDRRADIKIYQQELKG